MYAITRQSDKKIGVFNAAGDAFVRNQCAQMERCEPLFEFFVGDGGENFSSKILSTRLTRFSRCLSLHSSSEKAELSGDMMFLICLQVSITLTLVRLFRLLKMTEKIIQTLLTSFLTLSTADAAYNEIKSISVCND